MFIKKIMILLLFLPFITSCISTSQKELTKEDCINKLLVDTYNYDGKFKMRVSTNDNELGIPMDYEIMQDVTIKSPKLEKSFYKMDTLEKVDFVNQVSYKKYTDGKAAFGDIPFSWQVEEEYEDGQVKQCRSNVEDGHCYDVRTTYILLFDEIASNLGETITTDDFSKYQFRKEDTNYILEFKEVKDVPEQSQNPNAQHSIYNKTAYKTTFTFGRDGNLISLITFAAQYFEDSDVYFLFYQEKYYDENYNLGDISFSNLGLNIDTAKILYDSVASETPKTNDDGNLDDPTLNMKDNLPTYDEFQANRDISSKISAGRYFTLFLKDGEVFATGDNEYGQSNNISSDNITDISAGGYHSLYLYNNGTVLARGLNDAGQCDVENWSDIQQISAGRYHSVGLKSDGTVVCTGEDKYKACDVSDWTGIEQISAGRYGTFGLRNGELLFAGTSEEGLADIVMYSDIKKVATGTYHTLALLSDGTVECTGRSGNGSCNTSSWNDISDIAAGGYHSIGLKENGTVVATGNNDYGQLNVESWNNVCAISGGRYHTVAITCDGKMLSTGDNSYNQLFALDY